MGIQALFGPTDRVIGSHIHSICDALDIPYLESRLDLNNYSNNNNNQLLKEFSINLHPAQELINQALTDVIKYLNWTKLAIIYEDDYSLIKLRDLLVRSTDIDIIIRHADPDTYINVLREIKSKDIHNLVIDTRPEHMAEFLKGVS